MAVNQQIYKQLADEFHTKKVSLVAVSKFKSVADIQTIYNLGQLDFGENYVQELVEKEAVLPKDIRWHFIGHLQSNKVKYIAAFVHLIHGVDSEKLLKEINKQAAKNNRVINCLLQIHIAQEETKFGLDENELAHLMENIDQYTHVKVIGLMGMASFSDNTSLVQSEFQNLKKLFDQYQHLPLFTTLSMGMSNDYALAIQEGSNMVRIGSLIFGNR